MAPPLVLDAAQARRLPRSPLERAPQDAGPVRFQAPALTVAQRWGWRAPQRMVVVAQPTDAASARWVPALVPRSASTRSLVWHSQAPPVASQAGQQVVTGLRAVPVSRASGVHAQAQPVVRAARPERRRQALA